MKKASKRGGKASQAPHVKINGPSGQPAPSDLPSLYPIHDGSYGVNTLINLDSVTKKGKNTLGPTNEDAEDKKFLKKVHGKSGKKYGMTSDLRAVVQDTVKEAHKPPGPAVNDDDDDDDDNDDEEDETYQNIPKPPGTQPIIPHGTKPFATSPSPSKPPSKISSQHPSHSSKGPKNNSSGSKHVSNKGSNHNNASFGGIKPPGESSGTGLGGFGGLFGTPKGIAPKGNGNPFGNTSNTLGNTGSKPPTGSDNRFGSTNNNSFGGHNNSVVGSSSTFLGNDNSAPDDEDDFGYPGENGSTSPGNVNPNIDDDDGFGYLGDNGLGNSLGGNNSQAGNLGSNYTAGDFLDDDDPDPASGSQSGNSGNHHFAGNGNSSSNSSLPGGNGGGDSSRSEKSSSNSKTSSKHSSAKNSKPTSNQKGSDHPSQKPHVPNKPNELPNKPYGGNPIYKPWNQVNVSVPADDPPDPDPPSSDGDDSDDTGNDPSLQPLPPFKPQYNHPVYCDERDLDDPNRLRERTKLESPDSYALVGNSHPRGYPSQKPPFYGMPTGRGSATPITPIRPDSSRSFIYESGLFGNASLKTPSLFRNFFSRPAAQTTNVGKGSGGNTTTTTAPQSTFQSLMNNLTTGYGQSDKDTTTTPQENAAPTAAPAPPVLSEKPITTAPKPPAPKSVSKKDWEWVSQYVKETRYKTKSSHTPPLPKVVPLDDLSIAEIDQVKKFVSMNTNPAKAKRIAAALDAAKANLLSAQGPSPYSPSPQDLPPYEQPRQGPSPYEQSPQGPPTYSQPPRGSLSQGLTFLSPQQAPSAQGQPPQGQPPQGQPPQGQPPQGQPPRGQPPQAAPPPTQGSNRLYAIWQYIEQVFKRFFIDDPLRVLREIAIFIAYLIGILGTIWITLTLVHKVSNLETPSIIGTTIDGGRSALYGVTSRISDFGTKIVHGVTQFPSRRTKQGGARISDPMWEPLEKDLREKLPEEIHIEEDKHGLPRIPLAFWHAVRGFMGLRTNEIISSVTSTLEGHPPTHSPHQSADEQTSQGYKAAKTSSPKVVEEVIQSIKTGFEDDGVSTTSFDQWLQQNEKKLRAHIGGLTLTKDEFIALFKAEIERYHREIREELATLEARVQRLADGLVELQKSHKSSGAGGMTETEVKTLFESLLQKAVKSAQMDAIANGRIRGEAADTLFNQVNLFGIGSGAVVDPNLSSTPWTIPKNFFKTKGWYNRDGYQAQPPASALSPWNQEGDCFCAGPDRKGLGVGTNNISVVISRDIVPQHLVVEHILPAQTLDPGAMPKDIEVWAAFEEVTLRKEVSVLSETLYPNTPKETVLDERWVKIGHFVYEASGSSDGTQIFKLSDQLVEMNVVTNQLIVRAVSNYGADHTCFYRLRLYGDIRDRRYDWENQKWLDFTGQK